MSKYQNNDMTFRSSFIINVIILLNILILTHTVLIPSLPFDHIKYWLRNNPQHYDTLKKLCISRKSSNVVFDLGDNDINVDQLCDQLDFVSKSCWGYESQNDTNCNENDLYMKPQCNEDSNGWAANKVEQLNVFYNEADFGYVSQRKKEMRHYCAPNSLTNDSVRSSLECADFMRFCRSTNIYLNFEQLAKIEEPMRYRDDVIGVGDIGGFNCQLDSDGIKREGQHKSPLQSWFAEIENFVNVSTDSENSVKCDVWIEKPTYIMKLDATVNMYHHFCDFINLFATQHLNNSFFVDNNILIWDTYGYRSNFGVMWHVFTENPILNLGPYKGKVVCFRDAIFSLLPRMIYGIYYNMPLIPGCHKSGLFHAFNRHVLHKLNIKQNIPENKDEVRITLISRQTKYRRILNENELLDALTKRLTNATISKYDFNHGMPFIEQINISANSDILIGMHGAGLTHCLLQPDWGVLFELYNCDDPTCYYDLARLRGIKYITWSDNSKVFPQDSGHHPELGAHQKFTNYSFDVDEFVRLVSIATNHVRDHRNKYTNKRMSKECKSNDEL